MIDFSPYINLPLVWGIIIAFAVMMYVLLDGFDLGVGIIFPFAPSEDCRDKMISSIAPFWDGNETWLVMGGGGLFAAFPLAYSVIMPALYIPVILMLLALVFRGVSFEFRFKAGPKGRKMWDLAFHFGSLFATFMQGMILGGLVQGINVSGKNFAGSDFDWLSAYSFMTGIGLVAGYVLLGSSWVFMKTEGATQRWSKKVIRYSLIYVMFFMGLVSIWMPYTEPEVFARWFSWPTITYLMSIPVMVVACAYFISSGVKEMRDKEPFFATLFLFFLGFVGLLVSIWPYIVPRAITFVEAAAAPQSQSLMLIGVVIIVPVILAYTGYSFYVFRGKSKAENIY